MKQVLCIGQSDSCAGTGIQADVKTAQAFGGYATTVVTAVSAQNTQGIHEIHPIPAEIVATQIAAVMEDLSPTVVKTGMLCGEDTINRIGDFLDSIQDSERQVVIDPVMTNRTGRHLLDKPAKDALKRRLLIRADVLTPNVAEAEDLTGLHIRDLDEMIHAANMLMTLGARTVILKGGAITGDTVYDVLVDGQGVEVYRNDRVPSRATHGAGTTLSAGLATGLAQGFPVREAFARARAFVNRAIAEAKIIGKGYGPLNHQIRPSETLPVFGEQE